MFGTARKKLVKERNILGARRHDLGYAANILDIFQRYDPSEVNTARLYCSGSSETMLADLDWQKRGIFMETKLYPNTDVRRGLVNNLKAPKTNKIDMFYLHGPDRKTPFEKALCKVNNLYKEGLLTRFDRTTEAELFPCLRKYGFSLYALQPLAGGFLTGRYMRDQTEFEEGSRFDPKGLQGKLHQARQWNKKYFDALVLVQAAGQKHGLAVSDIALRWIKHHSVSQGDFEDAVIIGVSSITHLEDNLTNLERDYLPENVVSISCQT
ncbi:hypothetical protein G6011_06896 [Alternaria panax]|uniref:NADP-dependent oxidoreductase domain-containing protein n=1 Tax=Alternaria panax TaxID=48097 RepID=A0AAD4I1H6_9PLEO|nr:hypothetical protein G6011_06896 [Alternaria panax]